MIDYVMGIFLILFGLGFGILLGWVLSLPKDDEKPLPSDLVMDCNMIGEHIKEFTLHKQKTDNSIAYFDMDEWKECIKECPYYYYNEPKKKKEKGKSRKQSRKQ